MFAINGVHFDKVGIVSLQRGETKEYKYDLIAEDGTRRFEIRARYRTYNVTLGSITLSSYDALRSALAANGAIVMVTLPDGQTDQTFAARVELGDDALELIERDGSRRWDGLTLDIVGVNPLEDGQ